MYARHTTEAGTNLNQNGHSDVVVITFNILRVLQELGLQLCVAFGQVKNMRRVPVNDLYYRFCRKEQIHALF